MRAAARILGKIVLGLVLLVICVLLLADLALMTAPARAWVRARVVPLASEALHAQVELGAIDSLSLLRASASVRNLRIADRDRHTLASADRAQVSFNPFALVLGRLHFNRIELQRPYVDLGAPGAGGGGLLGLFESETPEPAPSAKKTDAGGGLRVELADVRITHGRAIATLGGARFGVHALDFHGDLHVEPGFAIGITLLECQLRRNDHPIGAIASVRGERDAHGQAKLALAADLAGAKIGLDATMGRAADAQAQPVSARLDVRGVSGRTLKQLGVDSDVLTAPVDLTLRAHGTTGELAYETTLNTPGGAVEINGRYVAPGALAATIRIAGLQPRRFLRADVAPLHGVIRVNSQPNPDANTTAIVLAVDAAAYDGIELPRVDARGALGGEGEITLDQLDARYGFGSISAHGNLARDGTLELIAHAESAQLRQLPPVERLLPQLSGAFSADARLAKEGGGGLQAQLAAVLQRPALGTTRAASLRVRGELHGPTLDSARVNAQLLGNDLDLGRTHLPMADIALTGGPNRYVAIGRFGEHGRADVTLVHRGSRFDADAEAHVVIDPHGGVLHAVVDDLSYSARVVNLRSAQFAYAGARAQLAGRYETDGAAVLRASVRAPDLLRVTAAFLPRAIPGALALDAQLTGTAQQPKLDADVHYRNGLLYGMPVQKLDATAHADVPARTLALEVDGRAGGGALHVSAKSTLSRSQLSERVLRAAEHDVTLELERIPLERVEVWPEGRFIPESAKLSGKVHVHGPIEQLELESQLSSRMVFPGEHDALTLTANASYAPAALELELSASDRIGPLLRTHMKTDLARDGIARDLPAVQKLIVERSWDASLWIGARRLDQLPAFAALDAPRALWPAQVSAQVELAHQPGAEPKGQVQVAAVWDPPAIKGGELQCGLSRRPELRFQANMERGELHTELHMAIAGRQMLAMQSSSHAPLDEWFEADPKRVQPASLRIEVSDLHFADIPVLCDTATGRLNGTVELKRALMREVSVNADLKAEQVQFGKAAPFDAVIDAHADRRAVLAHAKLTAARGSAVIAANIPVDGGGRMPTIALDEQARADIEFRRMEASALLAPIPGVRASAGLIDGKLTMLGTLRNPTLTGSMALDDVTATLGEAGQRFERVNGTLALNGRELHLYPTKLHDREGSLEVSGDLKMLNFQTWQAELAAKADDFPVRRSGVMVARFGGKLDVHANVDPNATELDVALSGARVELTGQSLAGVQSLAPHPDVAFVDGPPPEQKKPDTNGKTIVLRVHSKEPFWVRREDFSALVSTNLRVEVKNGETNLTGPVDIERGVVELLGQMFDIEQGKITFSGGHQVEPMLELTAMRRVPGGSLVTIEASGTLYRPTLNFLVDGAPVTAGEALATATGASAGTGSDETVQQELSSMAVGIASGVLTVGARRELGEWVPVLAIERGENETRLRAGVEADRFIPHFLRKVVVDAYVEGIFSAGQDASSSQTAAKSSADATSQDSSVQTQAGVLLELRFPKRLVGEAQYGPGERWSLDLNWQP